MKSSVELKSGDIVAFKKPHSCGSNRWMLIRAGSFMELRCIKCGRKIILARREFERRYKLKLE